MILRKVIKYSLLTHAILYPEQEEHNSSSYSQVLLGQQIPGEVSDWTHSYSPPGRARKYIEEYFHSKGVQLVPGIELSNLDLMVEFAVNGLGIACVAKDYVQKNLQSKQLFELPLKEKIPPRHLVAVTKKGMPISTATQRFIEIFCSMESTPHKTALK